MKRKTAAVVGKCPASVPFNNTDTPGMPKWVEASVIFPLNKVWLLALSVEKIKKLSRNE
ncbi:MAG: hypothetical protein LCH51_13690 [Bacteroidetes bacterium]|nr:hypothetical protein [Bacteroidota bacterium]